MTPVPKKVLLASPRGYCAGVDRAVQTVEHALDVYGPPVNLAARLTGVARRNRVIIDERTAELLPVNDFETRKLPARPLRGFGDVEPVTVRRTRPRH